MLLKEGDVQGPKVLLLRLQGWKCISQLQDLSVTTFNQVIMHNITNRGQPATTCPLTCYKMRNTALPVIYFCKNV